MHLNNPTKRTNLVFILQGAARFGNGRRRRATLRDLVFEFQMIVCAPTIQKLLLDVRSQRRCEARPTA